MPKDSSCAHKGLMTGWPHHSIPSELPRSFFTPSQPPQEINLCTPKCQGRTAKYRQAQEVGSRLSRSFLVTNMAYCFKLSELHDGSFFRSFELIQTFLHLGICSIDSLSTKRTRT